MQIERVNVNVGGVNVSFLKSSDLPLVYIHGSGCDATVWINQLREVGGYAVDLPRHGESDDAEIESVDDYAYFVARASEKLIGGAVFAGHSLGGAVAQKLFLNHRKVVRGLILISTGARLRVLPEVLEMLLKNPEVSVNTVVDVAFARRIPEADDYRKIFLERVEILAKDLQICDGFDLLGEYSAGEINIDVPTLILVGENDRLTPLKYSQFFHSHIPGSRLVIVPEASHMVMLEKPEVVSREIGDFVRKILEG